VAAIGNCAIAPWQGFDKFTLQVSPEACLYIATYCQKFPMQSLVWGGERASNQSCPAGPLNEEEASQGLG
jgi:hypothetical protein